MKNKWKNMLAALPVIAVSLSSCEWINKKLASSATDEDGVEQMFVTDSVHWADTLQMGANTAYAKVEGWYPSGGVPRLVDSTRVWIAEQMGYDDTARLTDGRVFASAVGKASMESARTDFEDFAQDEAMGDDFSVTYEYAYSFAPIFSTDSILTYNFSGYVYTAGAHGNSVRMGQTFAVSSGKRLGLAEMFMPEATARLTDLVRDGLRNQYFGATATGGEAISLEDALLISPDELPLPACPPLCIDTGVVFIYQQYEIAPYAAGMPTCVLPYEALRPLMRPGVIGLLPQ